MFSSFFRATDSDGSPGENRFFTQCKTFLTSAKGTASFSIKCVLASLKVITSGAQAFFGISEANRFVINNPDVTLPANIGPSTTAALLSAGFIGATRGPKMLGHSKPASPVREQKSLAYSDLNFFNKVIYCSLSTMAYMACFFSSIANYNFAFSLCETLVALSTDLSSKDDILDYINENPALQASIQIFSFLCFFSQMLSFSSQQVESAKRFLLNWWFLSENRSEQISLLGKKNILLLWSFFTYIPSIIFFAVFSTETGLHNLNNSFFKSILKKDISDETLDSLIVLSAFSTFFITTTNTVPSNYNYLSSSHKNVSLTPTGWLLVVLGTMDNISSTYCNFYGSLKTLSKTFDIDIHNPYLIGTIAILICPPNLICSFIYNTHKVVYESRHTVITDPLEEMKEGLITYSRSLGSSSSSSSSSSRSLGSSVVLKHQDVEVFLEDTEELYYPSHSFLKSPTETYLPPDLTLTINETETTALTI